VAVVAGDLPFLTADAVAALRAAAAGRDGATLVDDAGRTQYLAAVYAAPALRRALDALGDPADAPMRRLAAGLDLAGVSRSAGPPGPPPWFDCDAPGDVRAAREWADRAGPTRPEARSTG
jgi:molybdopterin-guanine dinucleotide biosynthesis protein A